MYFKHAVISVLLILMLIAAPVQAVDAMPQAYSEQIRLQAVESDVYAELAFQGEALKLARELTPENFPALTQVSLWAVDGVPPETMAWTDLPRLPVGVTLIVEFSPQASEENVSNQLSTLTGKIEEVFPVKFFDVTDLWLVGLGKRDLKVFYSPTDFSSYLKAYGVYIPTEYGGFTKLIDLNLYKSSVFSMLGVEFYGGSLDVKFRLIHKAEASAYQLKALKASVRESFNYKDYIEPSAFSEASTVEVRVLGGVISSALIPNLTAKLGGVLQGNFDGIEGFPDIYVAYSPGFQSQPYLKVVKVVDRTTWNQDDLVKITIHISNVGDGAALNVSVDDSGSLSNVVDYVALYEGTLSAVMSSISPGSTAELSYTLLIGELPPEKYVSLEATKVSYTDESMLNLYEASSNSLTVGLGVPVASLVPMLEVDRLSVKGGETVNASLNLVNIGESSAYNVGIMVQAGEEWLTQEVSEIVPLSTADMSIPVKVYGVNPAYSLSSAVFISYFSKGVPEVGSPVTVNPNSVDIYLTSRNLPQLKLVKTVDKEVCKIGDLIKAEVSVTVEGILPETSLILYEALPEGTTYQSGNFSQIPGAPSIVKGEIQPSELGEPSTLIYTVEIKKPEVLVFTPTLALVKVFPAVSPLVFYAENAPVASAAMSLTKSLEPSPEEGIIRVTVSALNQASISLSSVELEDTLPDEVELVEGEILSASTPILESGEILTLSYSVKLSKPLDMVVFPKAKVSYSFLFLTFQELSEEAKLTVSIPNVTIEKTFEIQKTLAGEPVEVSVRFANIGDSPIFNVMVSDNLPEGFELKAGNLTTEVPILNPGEELFITYTASTASDGFFELPRAEAEYTYLGLSFKAKSGPTKKLALGPKLSVSKTVEPADVKPGEAFTVKITIKNLGKKLEALNVKISDMVPLYAKLVEGSPQAYISSLPPGNVKTITYKLAIKDVGTFPLLQPTVTYSFPGGDKITLKLTGEITVTVAEVAPPPPVPSPIPISFLSYIIVIIVVALVALLLIRRKRKIKVKEEEFLS
jgi:uncharacterized repeat protein (TIGR01451 family)